jgi:HK97 family phage portal protein
LLEFPYRSLDCVSRFRNRTFVVSPVSFVSLVTQEGKPTMLNWLSQLVRPRPSQTVLKPAPSTLAPPTFLPVSLTASPPPISIPHLQAYEQSPWVFVAVNRIAEAAALVPMRVYDTRNGDRIELPQHPLVSLLENPNPYVSRFELLEQTLGLLELTGSAYWFLNAGRDGLPAEIWPLRPDRITIVPDEQDYIRGYLYEVDGQRVPLLPVEVVHFKRWHPSNDLYGFSALEAARLALLSDRAMAEWNRNTFGQDNGVPAGIVSVKDPMTDADFERLKREWRTSYGGTQRRTAFLRGGAVEWQSIGLSHTDLDFLQGRKAHRDEILNIFGVPVGLVSENATEANAKVAERLFIERTLYPKLVRLAQKITQDLLPFWDVTGTVVAAFDDIRPTDTQSRLEELRAAYPVLSINEIRSRFYQLPAVDWGNRPPTGQAQHLTPEPAPTDSFQPTVPSPAQPHLQVVKHLDIQSTISTSTITAEAPSSDSTPATEASVSATAEAASFTTNPASPTVSPHEELARWERFALKRVGKSNMRAFHTQVLPSRIVFEIDAQLQALSTSLSSSELPVPQQVRAIFASARQHLAEPEVVGVVEGE